ncbi:hypothetical protein MTsPCn7_22770 [Altererythrobacter sp. MTPC7]
MGGDKVLRFDAQRLRCADKVGLVLREEFEHCCLNLPLGQPFPQDIRGEAGQRKQPPGPVVIGQDPAQRAQRQRFGRLSGSR